MFCMWADGLSGATVLKLQETQSRGILPYMIQWLISVLRWRDTKLIIFMTLANSYTFLAKGICADGVSACS